MADDDEEEKTKKVEQILKKDAKGGSQSTSLDAKAKIEKKIKDKDKKPGD